MARISDFFGIIIYMYLNEHNPPHFHAFFGEHQAIFLIPQVTMKEGFLPPKKEKLVIKWALQHLEELMFNWNQLAIYGQPIKIKPLD
jgi:hypothetical protein